MADNNHPIPDISRLFIGARNEFEVETVFAKEGAVSPDEFHPFDEILILLEGTTDLELDTGVETLSGLTIKKISKLENKLSWRIKSVGLWQYCLIN